MMKHNDLQLVASFTEKSVSDEDGTLTISGYASTVNKDRVGDIIERNAWTKGGLVNYLKNPVVLAYHDHRRPIGRMINYSVDEVGLKITARISKAASDMIELIKDGVLQAFSVGVRVKDADYDSETDTFLIKDVELHEVSVVSVPANQDSLFSIAKCFESQDEFADFKKQFIQQESNSGETTTETPPNNKEEFIMDPMELKTLISDVVSNELAKAKEVEAAKAAAAAAETARREEITVIAKSGAEALVADLRKEQEKNAEAFSAKIAELQNEIVAKSEEIAKITRDTSRVAFSDRAAPEIKVVKEAGYAALLSKILKKPIEETSYGKALLEKAVNDSGSFRVASDKWEQELSNNLEEEIQLALRVAPTFREIQMNARNMVISINPDMGLAGWVTSAETHGPGGDTNEAKANRTDASTDPEVYKNLTEVTLTAPKMAAKSYITDEQEEDAIVAILPLIQEGLVRAHARKVENALLNDDGTTGGQTYVKGLFARAVTLSTSVQGPILGTAKFTGAHLLAARRKLGKYGLDLNDLVTFVSQEAWYDLLEDPAFADYNDVGMQAKKMTGQVGAMYGMPVIVSPEFPAAANGKVGICVVNSRNFLMTRRRGMTIQSDYDVEKQRRVLVATQRWGFSHIIAAATAVATVRYDDDGA